MDEGVHQHPARPGWLALVRRGQAWTWNSPNLNPESRWPGASTQVKPPRPHGPELGSPSNWEGGARRAYFSSMSMTCASALLRISVAWSAASMYIAWPALNEMSMV